MKEHIDPRPQPWKDSVDDYGLLVAAGVPMTTARKAADLAPYSRPAAVKHWLNHLDYVHKPTEDKFKEQPDLIGTGLILYGPSGTGKTVMAAQILRDILRSNRMHWVDDSSRSRLLFSMLGLFCDWQDLSEYLRQQHADTPPSEWETIRAALLGSPIAIRDGDDVQRGPFFGGGVVVLDDLSRERVTEYNLDRLHAILRKRHNQSLITVLTTNYGEDEWPKVYGPVLGSFMIRAFVSAEIS